MSLQRWESLIGDLLCLRTPWSRQPLCSHSRLRSALSAKRRISPTSRRGFASSHRRAQDLQATQEIPDVPIHSIAPTSASRDTPRITSAKLAALHARLSLPPRLATKTLAQCLIHRSVNPHSDRNNNSLALLGQQLLAYYTAEWLICHYPRLPMPILYAAQYAYTGPKTLHHICNEWGVEAAAAPGPEVDPGLLQFERVMPGNAMSEDGVRRYKDILRNEPSSASGRPGQKWNYRRGISSRIVHDDEFGNVHSGVHVPHESALSTSAADASGQTGSTPDLLSSPIPTSTPTETSSGVTLESASSTFVRALVGALYLASGSSSVHSFHEAHFLSRHLQMHKLFNFSDPTRDLSRLCAREEIEPPVARLISETGRHSRAPVFVVGVYSGQDKLGEDAGSSLNEARYRAAAAALRAWYLYSPPREQIMLPSRQGKGGVWTPQMIDVGEIIA